MHSAYSTTDPVHTAKPESAPANDGGAWLSVLGLVSWLCAMLMAVAGPLLNIEIPALLIVGTVLISAVLSLLSLPRLLNASDESEPD